MNHLERGGRYLRVADPAWSDPLGGGFSQAVGGRWNSADSFPVVYLCGDEHVARANVDRLYEGLPYGPEDIDRDGGPDLMATDVPVAAYVDALTAAGCEAVGLPTTYPLDADGSVVPWRRCQRIGEAAWEAGEPGIACRSAAPRARRGGEELAHFDRGVALNVVERRRFGDWY